ncbi:hypothetical protein Tsp_02395 [Trichinella spiralis]|uniref:hypothetical protein n=1 Tax=Trichinella spiralis TaxID=6334 RepID=UPI0001EFB30C|nr:hypothetical protein Tsp_02395 [Trichinella spiralis]
MPSATGSQGWTQSLVSIDCDNVRDSQWTNSAVKQQRTLAGTNCGRTGSKIGLSCGPSFLEKARRIAERVINGGEAFTQQQNTESVVKKTRGCYLEKVMGTKKRQISE